MFSPITRCFHNSCYSILFAIPVSTLIGIENVIWIKNIALSPWGRLGIQIPIYILLYYDAILVHFICSVGLLLYREREKVFAQGKYIWKSFGFRYHK